MQQRLGGAHESVHALRIATYGELVASLPDLSGEQIGIALEALVHFGRRKATSPLLRLLKSPNAEFQIFRSLTGLYLAASLCVSYSPLTIKTAALSGTCVVRK